MIHREYENNDENNENNDEDDDNDNYDGDNDDVQSSKIYLKFLDPLNHHDS
jgi:hypothetical protein